MLCSHLLLGESGTGAMGAGVRPSMCLKPPPLTPRDAELGTRWPISTSIAGRATTAILGLRHHRSRPSSGRRSLRRKSRAARARFSWRQVSTTSTTAKISPCLFHPSTPSKARARPIPPIIRFDGRAYGPGGGRRAFWNAVVLVAGAAVRHVVIESDPFAEIPPCTAMIGIVANEEGVSLEDIEVRSRSLRGEDGLAAGIDGYGNRGQVRNVRFRTGAGQFFWFEGACDLSGSTFENAGVALGEGNHVVSFNDFSSSSLILAPNSHARAHSNRFHDSPAGWPAIIIRGTPGAAADGPFIEENTIRDCLSGIICEGPGTARFRRNSIERFSGS